MAPWAPDSAKPENLSAPRLPAGRFLCAAPSAAAWQAESIANLADDLYCGHSSQEAELSRGKTILRITYIHSRTRAAGTVSAARKKADGLFYQATGRFPPDIAAQQERYFQDSDFRRFVQILGQRREEKYDKYI